MKLSKSEYNDIVKAQILTTGDYKGVHVAQAEEDSELYYYLQAIKDEYKRNTYTKINADSQIAKEFLQYTDDSDFPADLDDLYGTYNENMNDINDHFNY